MKKETRKLSRVGSSRSIAVVIPVEIIKDLKWREKQKVNVKRVARGVKITDAKSKKRK
jgi:antitoxin component of MazEF toxin-antitoxin module